MDLSIYFVVLFARNYLFIYLFVRTVDIHLKYNVEFDSQVIFRGIQNRTNPNKIE